jgi:cell division protein FtsW (lipid II flippase)
MILDSTSPLRERSLLVLAGAFIAVNLGALAWVRIHNGGAADAALQGALWPLFVWILCAVAAHLALARWLPDHDPLILPMVLFLSGWGLVLIERLAPNFAERQVIWLGVATLALVLTAALPHVLRGLRQYRYVLLVGGLLLLFSTIVLGTNPSGARNAPTLWLGAGSVFFQPSEALKIILVAFLASYLAEQYPALRALGDQQRGLLLTPRLYGPVLLMWGLSVVVLVWQRDLGAAILFFLVFLVLLYVASGHTRILLGGAALIAIAALIAYREFAVVQLRVDIWLNPWPEADGRAFQIVQSLMAFASGGIFGTGVGQGSPTYIPVVHSDFALAAIAEEWGLLGVVAVLCCVLVLVMRGLRAAVLQQRHPFHALLAVGLSTLVAVQSLLIIGGVLKVLPLTGVTLPFVSYGGSSLLMSFILAGLLLRLSAER